MLLLVCSCSCPEEKRTQSAPVHEECNSVYYWKTTFLLDSAQEQFLKQHDVGRIYLRMFDVSYDEYAEETVPNATVRFDYLSECCLQNSLDYLEFVPVVYITLDALKAMRGNEGTLAANIVTRVRNMCSYHSLPNVAELQLDCDWTSSTEQSFFNLCDSVRSAFVNMLLPWKLSSTIRLHQLSEKVPPVDRGVLMVYNTGSFNNPDTRNSIIDPDDVRPYLKNLPSYPLHLDVAYPTYSWQLMFRYRYFSGLMHGIDTSDTTRFAPDKANTVVVKRDFPYGNRIMHAGDMIRTENSDIQDILSVKQMIETALGNKPHSNILYHLDTNNLSNYSSNEIENIFSTAD